MVCPISTAPTTPAAGVLDSPIPVSAMVPVPATPSLIFKAPIALLLPIAPSTAIFPAADVKVKVCLVVESESIFPLKSINPLLALVLIVIFVDSSASPTISTLLRLVLEVVMFPPRTTFVLPSNLTDLISSALPITPAVIVAPSISTTSLEVPPISVSVTSPPVAVIVKFLSSFKRILPPTNSTLSSAVFMVMSPPMIILSAAVVEVIVVAPSML